MKYSSKESVNTPMTDILDYAVQVSELSKEKKLLHIYHKLIELLYVRKKEEVLNENNKIVFAKYSDLIERNKNFYDDNKKCLLLCNIKTISFPLFKCFDNCFNDIFIDGNNFLPVFKLNIKEFIDLKIYKYVTSQQIRFFLFLYLEKFLYSFPIFASKHSMKQIVSEGALLFNFDQISSTDLEDVSLSLFLQDINYIISIVAPIYIPYFLFYKSSLFKEKLYKIGNLMGNKKDIQMVFIDTEEELRQLIKGGSAYTQHQLGRQRNKYNMNKNKKNIVCDYNEFFLLEILFQENHRNTERYNENILVNKKELLKKNVKKNVKETTILSEWCNQENANKLKLDSDFFDAYFFDDIFLLEHINFKRISRSIKKRNEIEKEMDEKKKREELYLVNNVEDSIHGKKKIQFIENEVYSDIYNINYFKEAADQYYNKLLLKKEIENKIIDFITKRNCNENKIKKEREKDFYIGNVTIFNSKKKKKKKKEKRKIYIDLNKTKGDIHTCMYKNNLNYIGHLDALLRNSQRDGPNTYWKQPQVIANDFVYSEVPYVINQNNSNVPSIEVNNKSLQLRGFYTRDG